MRFRRISCGPALAIVALAMALCTFAAGWAEADSRTGIGVSYGGVGSPFGEAVEGAPDTRHRRNFGFGVQLYHLRPTGGGGDDAFWGGRIAVWHLSNDIRIGGSTVMNLSQLPAMAMLAYEKGFGKYGVGVHGGAGLNFTSVGKGELLLDLETDLSPLLITIDTDLSAVYGGGLILEYELSGKSTVVLDSNILFGSVPTTWEFTGTSVPGGLGYENRNIQVRHITVMLGINIDLGSIAAE